MLSNLSGCILEGCNSRPTLVEWVESLSTDKLAYRFLCTAKVYPGADLSSAFDNILLTVDLLINEIWRTPDGRVTILDDPGLRSDLAKEVAQRKFKSGIRFNEKYADKTVIISEVECNKIYELKQPNPIGQCKAELEELPPGQSPVDPEPNLPPPPPDRPSSYDE